MSHSENFTCRFFVICLETFNGNSLITTSVTITSVITSIFAICAVLANALVLAAYYMYWNSILTWTSNIFILGLALTDFLIGLVSGPACVTRTLLTLNCSPSTCFAKHVETNISIAFEGASLIILSLVSADRYVAIFKSLRYSTLVTKKRAVVALVSTMIVWSIFIAISFAGVTSYKYYSILGSVKYILFISFILGVYLPIYFAVKRIERNLLHLAPEAVIQGQIARSIREHKATQTMAYITWCVLATWLPTVVYGLTTKALTTSGNYIADEVLWQVAATCFHLGAVVNPLVYHWRNEELSLSMRKVLSRLIPAFRKSLVVPFVVPTAFVIAATPCTKSPAPSPRVVMVTD